MSNTKAGNAICKSNKIIIRIFLDCGARIENVCGGSERFWLTKFFFSQIESIPSLVMHEVY